MKKNLGSSNSSSPRQTSKNGCQTPILNIKKSEDDKASPYKNALGQIKPFSLNNDGEDDFSTPKPTKTIPKIFKQQKSSKKGISKKSKTNNKSNRRKPSSSILKHTKDNFKNLDVNPEHLQMALALSKSTFAQEYPDSVSEPDLSSFLSPQQIPKVTTFLEKYGFKSNKNQLRSDSAKNHLEEAKKRKKSKFRFVTPILYIRTTEERESLINSKVSLILNQQTENILKNDENEKLNSTELRKYFLNNKFWNISSVNDSNEFITPSLQLSPPKLTVGSLLKNWDEIPGREKSPQRVLTEHNTNNSEEIEKFNLPDIDENTDGINIEEHTTPTDSQIEENVTDILVENQKSRHCSSPDLFESDNESNPEKTPKRIWQSFNQISVTNSSQREQIENEPILKTPHTISNSANNSSFDTNSFEEIEQNDKGIEHFESFYDDYDKLDEKDSKRSSFVDLTQSSSEDDAPNKINDKSPKNNQKCEEENLREAEGIQLNITENNKNVDQISNLGRTFGTKYSSVDSGNVSLECNNSKSLNVTDYILGMLNSQEDTIGQKDLNNEALSQSQSTCSQESIIIISDEELNYSNRYSAHFKNEKFYDLEYFDDCIGDNFENEDIDTIHSNLKNKYSQEEQSKIVTPHKEIKPQNPIPQETPQLLNKASESDVSTPKHTETIFHTDTPDNNLIIKVNDVTPMADYDLMDTPKIKGELDKFGIKPLKRRRGIQLLKYIYETTHPVINAEEFDDENLVEKDMPLKRRKLNASFENNEGDITIIGEDILQNECDADLLFERKFSKKIHSSRIPLQIAWYNFLSCNVALKENILLYEPIQLEVVHSMLKEQSGFSFHIEELITFLDKKCITFRTNQSHGSRKRAKS